MDLSIIIINWNSVEYLIQCIKSIREQTKNLSYEIIVVDNASFDGCGEMIAREHPEVIFIQNQCNMGFAGANNLGASKAKAPILLFLNPDTIILNNAIEHLYEIMKNLSDAGILGCRMLNNDRSIQTSCVLKKPTPFNRAIDSNILRRLFPKFKIWGTWDAFQTSKPIEVEAVSGACMMIKKENFFKIGGFNTSYFMYGEDIDLCARVQKLGLKVYHIPKAEIIHFGGMSSIKQEDQFGTIMMRVSWEKFIRMNRGLGAAFVYRFLQWVSAIFRIQMLLAVICLTTNGRRNSAFASLKKWWSILKWTLGGCPK